EENKITISQALHQRASAEPVCAMIGEIGFTDHEQAGHIAHQIVIHPETPHGVVHGGINSHWHFVGVLAGNLLIHLEQVSVALANRLYAEPFDRVGKIEIHAASARTDTAAFVANFLRSAR